MFWLKKDLPEKATPPSVTNQASPLEIHKLYSRASSRSLQRKRALHAFCRSPHATPRPGDAGRHLIRTSQIVDLGKDRITARVASAVSSRSSTNSKENATAHGCCMWVMFASVSKMDVIADGSFSSSLLLFLSSFFN